MIAIADLADQEVLAGFPWRPLELEHTTYALAQRGKLYIYMHRLVIGAGPKDEVDHRNRNGLDNRRSNLRFCTHTQNSANRSADRRKRGTSSRFKGVYWKKDRKKWIVNIHVDGKTRYVGRFTDEIEAANAYDLAAVEVWGEFARLNLPEEVVPCA